MLCRLKLCLALPLMFAIASSVHLGLAQTADFKVQVVGLSVALPDPDSEYGGAFVMGRQPGTEIQLRVSSKDATILKVAEEGDTATKLQIMAGGKSLGGEESNYGFMSSIADDKHSVVLPVNAEKTPPADTDKLTITGKIVVVVGSDPKKDDVTFELKDDATVKLGPVEVTLSDVSEDDFGETVTNVTFNSTKSMEAVGKIEFKDAAGKSLEASPSGHSSFGFGDDMNYQYYYRINGKAGKVTATVEFFNSTKTMEIEVKEEVGLGLGK